MRVYPGLDHSGVKIDGFIKWTADEAWQLENVQWKPRHRKRSRKKKATLPETVAERSIQSELQVLDGSQSYRRGR